MNLYRECTGSGTPVLLIHGALSDHMFFSGLVPYLSTHYQVILYDRIGYGKSNSVADSNYTLSVQAEDACRVLQSFTSEPAFVVGHSAGAHIALELAIQHPHLVKKLVLIEPSLGTDPNDAMELAEWHNELLGYVNQKQLLRIFPSFQRVTGGKPSIKKTGVSPRFDATQVNRMRKNLKAFSQGDLPQMDSFNPREEQIRQLSIPVVVGVTQQKNNMFYKTAIHDSAYFDWPIVPFPGMHSSIEEHSKPFAEKLGEIFGDKI